MMFYALNWFIVFSLLALWSLVSWGFHAIAAWMISNTGALKGDAGEILSLGVPGWLLDAARARFRAAGHGVGAYPCR